MTNRHRLKAQCAWPLAGMLLFASIAGGCGGGSDYTLDEWTSEWSRAQASLPPLDEMLGPEDHEACSATVGTLRQATADLQPAPNEDLAEAFLYWAEFSEGVFFDCPLQHGIHSGWEPAYEEMSRLASEVDALIAFESGIPSD